MDVANALDIASPYTKSPRNRLNAMARAVQHVEQNNIAGDIVECGVWRGGNIILARLLAPERLCWLYDTFEGMTMPGVVDMTASRRKAIDKYEAKQRNGQQWNGCSVGDVLKVIVDTDTYDERHLRFVKGDVCETLLVPENVPGQISVLRLDTDWYASTRVELEILYPRLSAGGVLIVDDYGHWLGARKAVDEYLGTNCKFTKIDYTAVMLEKPC